MESLAARDLLQVLVARAREAFLASGVGVDHGNHSHSIGVLKVTVHQAGTLRIPLPETVLSRDVVVEGATTAPTFEADGTLVLENVQVNQVITVRLTLPEREIDLGHRNHSIRVRVRGN